MALTRNDFTGDSSTTVYDVVFDLGFLQQSDIYVSLDSEDYTTQLGYTWLNSTQIVLDAPVNSGDGFSIRRVVERNQPINDYTEGAILRENNLDDSFLQALMILQEISDGYATPEPEWVIEKIKMLGNIDMDGYQINNLGKPINLTDAVRLGDVLGIIDDDLVTIPSVSESKTLTDGQTVVTFTEYTTTSAEFHINGTGVDSRRLNSNDIDVSATTETSITLLESYPADTVVTLTKRTGTGDGIDSGVRREFVHNFATLAEAKASTKIAVGDSFETSGYYSAGDGGGAK